MSITQIKVMYRRTKQPAPYETKEAMVELTMAIDEAKQTSIEDAPVELALQRATDAVVNQLSIPEKEPAKKAASASKPKTKKVVTPAKEPAPEVKVEEPAPEEVEEKVEAPTLSQTDVRQAVSQTVERLKKAGVADAPARVNALVKAYIPNGKPPLTYTRIPADSFGDFISDLEKMKADD